MLLLTIIAAYFGSAAIAFTIGRERPLIATRCSQIIGLIIFLLSLGLPMFIQQGTTFNATLITLEPFTLDLNLTFDNLTWVMLGLVSFLSLNIHSYASRYLLSDQNQGRFIGQLSLLSAAVTLLCVSGDLLTAFIAWQFIGMSLYLLLNHYHYDAKANQAAKKKFMINRVGDVSFLIAVILAEYFYHSSDFAVLAQQSGNVISLIVLLVFIAMMTKSAQFPFHIWLPDTMETPTPVSAMMHAGVINAGGLLLARMSASYISIVWVMDLVFITGLVTAVCGQWFMQSQVDTKKRLAYSTMGQMGYMVMQCGLGCFASAVFHLIAHGLYKACLFLNAGTSLKTANRATAPTTKPGAKYFAAILSLLTIIITLLISENTALANQLSAVIWLFMGISLYSLLQQCYVDSIPQRIGLSLVVIGLFCAYLLALSFTITLFSDAIVERARFTLTPFVLIAAMAATLMIILASHFIKSQCSPRLSAVTYRHGYNKLDVEWYFRQILINPVRQLGDWLIRILEVLPRHSRTLLLIAYAIVSLFCIVYLSTENHLQKYTLISYGLLSVMIIVAIIANRRQTLESLLTSLALFTLTIVNVAFCYGSAGEVIGLFQLCSAVPVLIAMVLLLRARSNPQKARTSLVFNRLPWCHFYLSVILIVFIGLPGTSSFMTEILLMQMLIAKAPLAMILLPVTVLFISLAVLNCLQKTIFNPRALRQHAAKLSPSTHILVLTAITINLINGLAPTYALNTITQFVG
ncbi:MAG: hypothetical protein CMF50_05930 [Legionellales bacterium]|nr:hypothetical protein [Legionellales bacterium]|tara:strand:- start:65577 stop:67817 length:2241 start_codon:yes stop_codon:yes gene_type:complete